MWICLWVELLLEKKMKMSNWEAVKYQLLTYCYLYKIINNAHHNLMGLVTLMVGGVYFGAALTLQYKHGREFVATAFYIISAINHYVTRERHECNIELIKDSLQLDINRKK